MALMAVIFRQDFRCFVEGEVIEFRHGLNLIVGDQGCGKSTLLWLLMNPDDHHGKEVDIEGNAPYLFRGFDFEKNNPRTKSVQGIHPEFQMNMMAKSHGESNRMLLDLLEDEIKPGTVVLLDEPDMALSIRSCSRLCRIFNDLVKKQCQVIASCHNPIPIMHAHEVLSLEHRTWMSSKDYIASANRPRGMFPRPRDDSFE